MASRADIKDIVILKYLNDEMIDKLLPELELIRFSEGEIIFRTGDPADTFYMLKRGKILIEQRISEKVTVSVGTVKPGYSFGWSALLDEETFPQETVCGELCEVLKIKAKTLFNLIEQDYEFGFRFMHRALHMVRRRMDARTELLLKLITDQPEMHSLLEDK